VKLKVLPFGIWLALGAAAFSVIPTHVQAQTQSGRGRRPAQPAAAASEKPPKQLLRVEGVELWQGKYEFENVGVNAPTLFYMVLQGKVAEADSLIDDAVKAGVRLIRLPVAPRDRAEAQLWAANIEIPAAAFQQVLLAVQRRGVGVVPVLCGDGHAFLAPKEPVPDLLKQGMPANTLALCFISRFASRFKGDPRILFYDIGEGLNASADLPVSAQHPASECFRSDQVRGFLAAAATAVKAADPQRLVGAGLADFRPNSNHLREVCLSHTSSEDPWLFLPPTEQDTFAEYASLVALLTPEPLDILSIAQTSPSEPEDRVRWLVEDADHALRLPWLHNAAGMIPARGRSKSAGRPLFICSFGQEASPSDTDGKAAELPWCTDFIRRLRTASAPVAALANWEGVAPGSRAAKITPTNAADIVSLLFTVNSALYTAARDSQLIR
jgi:hypothetical protein